MQVAFRVQTDAAILGADGMLTTKCAKGCENLQKSFLAKAQSPPSFTEYKIQPAVRLIL
jgi:hypothetical protein